MNELKKTLIFCLAAVALAAAAVVIDPGARTPDILSDQGELFFPDFTDPQAPKAIEVIDYDEDTATATPLKIEFSDNKWVIPSHFGYPADAENRLADTAAALIELTKDIVVSENNEDHAEYGVVDPLDETATSFVGRGKRVTLRDGEGAVLADFVIGKEVEGKAGYRYLRVPNQRRVYAVETDADVSAGFEDWIETDLLKLAAGDLEKITINSYSINERLGRIENKEKIDIAKKDDDWRMGSRKPNAGKMSDLTAALDELKIVDVQPKPEGLTRDLKAATGIQLTRESFQSLRGKGFFVNQYTGQLLSNEGEIIVDTKNGLRYTLRFGEIASGPQTEVDAEGGEEVGERRYLFITVDFSEARAKQFEGDVEKGKELEEELRNRFSDWYYVISGADFNNLRPSRQDLRG